MSDEQVEAAFAAGDVVVLKSGGPPMTVSEVLVTGSVSCQWFNGGAVEKGVFSPACLRRPKVYEAKMVEDPMIRLTRK